MEFPTPLHALAHWAQVQGDAPFLTQPLSDGSELVLSWLQVEEQARRAAAYLVSLDLPPRSNIVLTGKNTAHWIVADLAIWMAGHVSVPVYPTLGAEATAYILDHCAARLVVIGRLDGQGDSWEQVREVLPPALPRLCLPEAPDTHGERWEAIQARCTPLEHIDLRDPEALATIIYTSGTTGKPKGVMHCFRSLMAPCRCSEDLWRPAPEDRMLSYLPLAHIGERAAVEIPALVFGFQLFFNRSLDTFAQDLKRARPTRFFTVPRLWTKFYQAVNAKLPPLQQRILFALPMVGKRVKRRILAELGLDATRVALAGAAPMPADLLAWYRRLGLEILDVFGMTENAATSHASRPGQVRLGYVGIPLPGVECRIDASGEVLVRSPGQMLGYYRMEEETQRLLTEDGFFHTGDRGEVSGDGFLRITGRVKELFKTSKGKYVAPVPIENLLAAHPAIEVSCVTGPGQPQPFALAVLSPGTDNPDQRARLESELDELLQQVNRQLEEHERLDYIVLVKDPWTIESGALTPTLKLRREVIEQRCLPLAEGWRGSRRRVIWE
ncbi:AMP-binding acetyl-CoA synthetase [Mangrovimicrobium sediminis]|uniref:AMP-binding acetyl-CoA synthetase n=1 Tax=Mangrovimicrobium sediminis TaxID=2562682 RepID=A0A4Z0M1M4_9GAMM|nr:AMP-binding protein [Haliea sp. SAOS-164]TGD73380.1 AMP-binding acetyl-CoA synthetase [Haliea sp. SAOS-164]